MSALRIPTTAAQIMPCVITPKVHITACVKADTLETDTIAQVVLDV